MSADSPIPNVDLLTRVVEHIEGDPDSWDQSDWFDYDGCRTTFCIAGWACVLTGMVARNGTLTSYGMGYVKARAEDWYRIGDLGELWSGNADDVPWEPLARELLSVSEVQADRLFEPGVLMSVATLRGDIKRSTGIDLQPRVDAAT